MDRLTNHERDLHSRIEEMVRGFGLGSLRTRITPVFEFRQLINPSTPLVNIYSFNANSVVYLSDGNCEIVGGSHYDYAEFTGGSFLVLFKGSNLIVRHSGNPVEDRLCFELYKLAHELNKFKV